MTTVDPPGSASYSQQPTTAPEVLVRLEDLTPGSTISGLIASGDVTIVAIGQAGPDASVITYRDANRKLDERVVYRSDEASLSAATATRRPFDADGADFRLAAEAQRIQLAGLFDPMLALATSAVDPLPIRSELCTESCCPARHFASF